MAMDDRPADDLQRIAWTPVGDLPGEPTFDQLEQRPRQRLEARLDYGDIDQQAEMDGLDGAHVEEPLELVDAPVPIEPPTVPATATNPPAVRPEEPPSRAGTPPGRPGKPPRSGATPSRTGAPTVRTGRSPAATVKPPNRVEKRRNQRPLPS